MIDVLCVDKTGTLTENELAVATVRPLAEGWTVGDVLAFAALTCSAHGQDPVDAAIRVAALATPPRRSHSSIDRLHSLRSRRANGRRQSRRIRISASSGSARGAGSNRVASANDAGDRERAGVAGGYRLPDAGSRGWPVGEDDVRRTDCPERSAARRLARHCWQSCAHWVCTR